MNATAPTLPHAILRRPRRADAEMCGQAPWGPAEPRGEENPWMQKDDIASAWAVSALTLAALAFLAGLAVLG